ncbi:MAG: hypothetical protein K0S49_49 [Microbacterium sp.]|jgi:hypothetical protein|nr:hypothetical protein [Microbacterium sp.]
MIAALAIAALALAAFAVVLVVIGGARQEQLDRSLRNPDAVRDAILDDLFSLSSSLERPDEETR